jgi:hypothetical protein
MPRDVTAAKRAASPTGPNPTRAPEPSGQERQYAPKHAAAFLNVSVSFLAKARMRGDGPPYGKFGRSVRYGESALIRYMKSRQRLSTSEK